LNDTVNLGPCDLFDFFRRNHRRLSDVEWLRKAIWPQCRNERRRWAGGRLQMLQNPWEFAEFMVLMARKKVHSYLEIGMNTGGSFYMMDSYLRASLPFYQRSVGYDSQSRLVEWEAYQAKFPGVEFRNESSSIMNLGTERFDVCFIDASHLERAVRRDFEKVKRNCRMVAFHDIAAKKDAVGRAWRDIKASHRYREFIAPTRRSHHQMGIGVLLV
jgi:predicted O-methyltransferase YrrM